MIYFGIAELAEKSSGSCLFRTNPLAGGISLLSGLCSSCMPAAQVCNTLDRDGVA